MKENIGIKIKAFGTRMIVEKDIYSVHITSLAFL